jgi:hypothetical protein
MTDNRINLEKGYLVNLEVLDFHIEYWFKEFIATAFYPIGSVVIIEQLCLSGTDFSALSLCLNIRERWLPRRVMLNAGQTGIMFRVKTKGFIDLNESPAYPPSSDTPNESTPFHQSITTQHLNSQTTKSSTRTGHAPNSGAGTSCFGARGCPDGSSGYPRAATSADHDPSSGAGA